MNQPIAPATSALSAFFRNLPDTLQQPASLALLCSVGAHAFFFATLPAFTSTPDNPQDLRIVRTVQLTPEEQSRLPQSPVTSQLGLPPTPNSDSKSNVPLSQPFPQIPVPDASQLYKIPDLSIPNPPAIAPLPPLDLSRYITPTRPPAPSTRSQATTFNGTQQIPALTGLNPVTQSSSQSFPPSTTPSTNTSGSTPSNIPNLNPQPAITPPNSNAQATVPNSAPNSAASAQPATPSRIDRLVAANRELSALYARENFVFNPMGASLSEWGQQATQNYQDWFKQNITDKGVPDTELEEKKIEREIPFRSPTPLDAKYDPALVYVLLDPQGKVVASPTVLGRTGYKYLDILAEKAVNDAINDLKSTGKYVIYAIRLTFKPEGQAATAPPS